MEELINLGQNPSSHSRLNLLTKERNMFLMDNHLGALWCWLQIIDTSQKYNLFHIDGHNDLAGGAEENIISALNGENIKDIPLVELTQRVYQINNHEFQSFRWDNYFKLFKKTYPDLINEYHFATHELRDLGDDWPAHKRDPWETLENLSYYIKNEDRKNDIKWIVNIDIDYFFFANQYYGDEECDFPEKIYQIFTDVYVKQIAERIIDAYENIEVLTIALSPECCGGWNNAVRIGKIFVEHLGFEFPDILERQ